MGFFEYFSSQETEQIHTATMTVLEKTGMNFKHEPALDLFKKAGCKVDGVRVFLTREFVEKQIKKAPSQFTLYARNPEKNVVIGGDNIAFMPCYGSPFVNCLDHGRRPGTLEDFRNFAKLACALPYFDITGGMMVEPNDIPVEIRNAERIYAAMTLSDKPFMGAGTNGPDALQTLDMASMVFGSREEMAKKPPFVSILTSLTPLGFDDKMCAGIMAYAEAAMPQLISSLSIAGATTPVTMEGTLVVQNAEVLAGICLAQLVREGAPVIFAGSSSAAAMHYGTLSIGAPEMAVNTAATAQMGRFYNLPSRGGGALTDAGILEGYMTASYEKFMIDAEMMGMCRRIKKGEEIIPEKLAVNVIDQVGPGGEYLTNRHTFQYFRSELYAPMMEERRNFDAWTAKGSLSMAQQANAKYKEILAGFQAPDMDPGIQKDLDRYMAKIRNK
jgi:trimethylamine--corrinoid protein Co-methyltransferase